MENCSNLSYTVQKQLKSQRLSNHDSKTVANIPHDERLHFKSNKYLRIYIHLTCQQLQLKLKTIQHRRRKKQFRRLWKYATDSPMQLSNGSLMTISTTNHCWWNSKLTSCYGRHWSLDSYRINKNKKLSLELLDAVFQGKDQAVIFWKYKSKSLTDVQQLSAFRNCITKDNKNIAKINTYICRPIKNLQAVC